MGLEKELKQKEFKNEHQKLLINLLHISGWIDTLVSEKLGMYGFNSQNYNVLRILHGQKGNSIDFDDIKSRLINKNSDLGTCLIKLINKGLVEKKADKYRLSSKGTLIIENSKAMSDSMEKVLHAINSEEANSLNSLLEKVKSI